MYTLETANGKCNLWRFQYVSKNTENTGLYAKNNKSQQFWRYCINQDIVFLVLGNQKYVKKKIKLTRKNCIFILKNIIKKFQLYYPLICNVDTQTDINGLKMSNINAVLFFDYFGLVSATIVDPKSLYWVDSFAQECALVEILYRSLAASF